MTKRAKAKPLPKRRKGAQPARAAHPLTFGQLCSAALMLGAVPTGGATADKVAALLAKSLQQGIIKRDDGHYVLPE